MTALIVVCVWVAMLGLAVLWLARRNPPDSPQGRAAEIPESSGWGPVRSSVQPRVWRTTQPGEDAPGLSVQVPPEAYADPDLGPWVNTIPSGPMPLGDRDDEAHDTAPADQPPRLNRVPRTTVRTRSTHG